MQLPFVRSASLLGYQALVEELGGSADALLRQAHISPELLRDADSLVPAQSLCDLLEISARDLACEDFGLRLSTHQGISMLGMVGFAIQQEATVGEALQALGKYLHLHSQAGVIHLSEHQGMAFLQYTPLFDYQGQSRQLIDLTLGVGLNLFHRLSGGQLKAQGIYLSYDTPQNLGLYAKLFKAPLRFNQELNGVTLDAASLSMAIRKPAAESKLQLDHYFSQLEHAQADTLEFRVSLLMRQLVSAEEFSQAQLASLLGVSARTLQRRFKEQGTSYQQLLDDTRKGMALRYLKESTVSVTQLAVLLGYAEVSVFSRAFQRWLGCSPRQYLATHQIRLKRR